MGKVTFKAKSTKAIKSAASKTEHNAQGSFSVKKVSDTSPVVDKQDGVEDIGTVVIKGPPANVGVSMSRTLNLGEFNSAKVEVSCHIPCKPTQEDMDGTFEFAKQWADEKMEILVDELKGE